MRVKQRHKEFCTVSPGGITFHYQFESTFMTIEQFQKEYYMYIKLREIHTIRNLVKIKIFNKWKSKYRRNQFLLQKKKLNMSLLKIKPNESQLIQKMQILKWKMIFFSTNFAIPED